MQTFFALVAAAFATYAAKEIANGVLFERIGAWLRPQPLTFTEVASMAGIAFVFAILVGFGLRIGFKGFPKRD